MTVGVKDVDQSRHLRERLVSRLTDARESLARQIGLTGGRDPLPGCLTTNHGTAVERSLYRYLGPSEVFRCPRDKGKISEDCPQHPQTTLLPSCWQTRGFSYQMNVGSPIGLPLPSTRRPVAGTLDNKPEGWVPDPSRFILFYEPPASPQVCHHSPEHFRPRWYQWHRNRGKTEFLDPRLAPGLFYSPILFVDAHCAEHASRGASEAGPKDGLANPWKRTNITKKAHARRGQETKWEIPTKCPRT